MTTDDNFRSAGRAMQELAAAAAGLVVEHDVIGTVTSALAGCVRSVGAAAAGIIVTQPGRDTFEFLAATNHRAEQLELYLVQRYAGPAADTIRSGSALTVFAESFADKWPDDVAAVLRGNGVSCVHACPLKWQNTVLGALNLFFVDQDVPDDIDAIAQAFSDLSTLAIVHNDNVPTLQVIGQLRAALADRATIEQAKGVIAYSEDLSLSDAYDRLLSLAQQRRQPLTLISKDVIQTAMSS
jgi:hypothetical protein